MEDVTERCKKCLKKSNTFSPAADESCQDKIKTRGEESQSEKGDVNIILKP
jgi:hypothetical protein